MSDWLASNQRVIIWPGGGPGFSDCEWVVRIIELDGKMARYISEPVGIKRTAEPSTQRLQHLGIGNQQIGMLNQGLGQLAQQQIGNLANFRNTG